MRPVSLLLLASLATSNAACVEADDSYSCTDGELLARAKSAASRRPDWYEDEWGLASFASSEQAPRREVCVNDAREARRVAEESNARLSLPPTELVGERETARFFELARKDSGALWRVHRCSYLDRSAYDAGDRSESVTLGTLAVRPITFEVARDAALYAWSLQPQGAVISEPTTIEAGVYGQDFESATLVSGDLPDEVTVRHVRITVDATTGEIRRSIGAVVAEEKALCSGTRTRFP